MGIIIDTLIRMGKSIFSNDFYILICFIITLLLLKKTKSLVKNVDNEVQLHHQEPSKRFANYLSEKLNVYYNLFTTMITIFPLLGMFGTVSALLGINLDGSDYKTNFFGALTSTAWGIVFAIVLKIINALIEYDVLSKIEAAEEIIEEDRKNTIKNGEPNET